MRQPAAGRLYRCWCVRQAVPLGPSHVLRYFAAHACGSAAFLCSLLRQRRRAAVRRAGQGFGPSAVPCAQRTFPCCSWMLSQPPAGSLDARRRRHQALTDGTAERSVGRCQVPSATGAVPGAGTGGGPGGEGDGPLRPPTGAAREATRDPLSAAKARRGLGRAVFSSWKVCSMGEMTGDACCQRPGRTALARTEGRLGSRRRAAGSVLCGASAAAPPCPIACLL
ncbi:hypothetical protein FA09DRAFT_217539 [Tilletiopsis washingtonensis]|jgi:hypothetical protein|uniref:Uncharacterized protein n=1 Tax=Tilletiopsis washingtonensis TaxID=58919 RepID=A0A316ZDB8_9BASI|nr:hypothetical protein FA09DRAFT_217539 [Tilletiopsis washingtonensis]PWN99747.1 hypothetical protein FA09DRAFT_217539 [Tilletiopsis washingtonensis]